MSIPAKITIKGRLDPRFGASINFYARRGRSWERGRPARQNVNESMAINRAKILGARASRPPE